MAKNINQLKGQLKALELQKELADDNVKAARNILYAIAGVSSTLTLYNYFIGRMDTTALIISLIFSAVAVALGLWTLVQPIFATLAAAFIITPVYWFGIYTQITTVGFDIIAAVRVSFCLLIYVGVYNAIKAQFILKKYHTKRLEIEQRIAHAS